MKTGMSNVSPAKKRGTGKNSKLVITWPNRSASHLRLMKRMSKYSVADVTSFVPEILRCMQSNYERFTERAYSKNSKRKDKKGSATQERTTKN